MVLCRLSEREEPYGPSVALEDGDETQLTIELGPSAVTLLSLGAVGDPEPETARSEGPLRVDSTRHDDSNGCADTEVEQALRCILTRDNTLLSEPKNARSASTRSPRRTS
jgi:hypothetical protein